MITLWILLCGCYPGLSGWASSQGFFEEELSERTQWMKAEGGEGELAGGATLLLLKVEEGAKCQRMQVACANRKRQGNQFCP